MTRFSRANSAVGFSANLVRRYTRPPRGIVGSRGGAVAAAVAVAVAVAEGFGGAPFPSVDVAAAAVVVVVVVLAVAARCRRSAIWGGGWAMHAPAATPYGDTELSPMT